MFFEVLISLGLSLQSATNCNFNYHLKEFQNKLIVAKNISESRPIAADVFYSFCVDSELSRKEKIEEYSMYVANRIEELSCSNLSFSEIIGARSFPVVTIVFENKSVDCVKQQLFNNLLLESVKQITLREYRHYEPIATSEMFNFEKESVVKTLDDNYIDYRYIPYDNFENGTPYTGSGVKIGVADFGPFDKDHSNFADTNILMVDMETKNGSLSTSYSHADYVMSILTGKYGIVPNANIVLVDANSSNYSGFTYLDLFAYLGVDIVNLSLGTIGSGCNLHSYFDFFVYNYQIPVVCSAPNGLTGYLTQPNSAQNVISVCSTDDSYTITNGAYLRDPQNNGGVYNGFRISAMGDGRTIKVYDNDNVNGVGGTSMATPVVTGAIALMMEKNPNLKGNVPMLMAALGNGANRNIIEGGSTGIVDDINPYNGLCNWSGVGALDIAQSLWISGFISTPNISLSPYSIAYLFSINNVSPGQTIYTTHCWLQKYTFDGNTYTAYTLSDFDLWLYDSSDNLISSTTGTWTNVERHKFEFTLSGNYTMKIKIYNSTLSSSVGQYGLSCVRAS